MNETSIHNQIIEIQRVSFLRRDQIPLDDAGEGSSDCVDASIFSVLSILTILSGREKGFDNLRRAFLTEVRDALRVNSTGSDGTSVEAESCFRISDVTGLMTFTGTSARDVNFWEGFLIDSVVEEGEITRGSMTQLRFPS